VADFEQPFRFGEELGEFVYVMHPFAEIDPLDAL
jgi:hypothetical protein